MAHQYSKFLNPIYGLKASTANTTTDQDTAVIDMAGYEGAQFAFILGNTTGDATFTCIVKGSTASAGNYVTISGTSLTSTTAATIDEIMVINVHRPVYRYLKGNLARAGANSAHGGVVINQYGPKFVPITDSTTCYSVTTVVSAT